jgi:hypothetical protein
VLVSGPKSRSLFGRRPKIFFALSPRSNRVTSRGPRPSSPFSGLISSARKFCDQGTRIFCPTTSGPPSSCPRAPGTFSSTQDGLAKPVRAQGSHPRIEGPCCQKGRAPHAPKEGITLNQMSPLSGHHPLVNPSVRMTRRGLRVARIRGRTECVPPKKPPSALCQGFPR